jgi:hypothetical protein
VSDLRVAAGGGSAGHRSEEAFQTCHVTVLGRRDEGPEQALLLGAVGRMALPCCEVLAGAADQLAGVGLGDLQRRRDLGVRVVEGSAEDVRRSFRR